MPRVSIHLNSNMGPFHAILASLLVLHVQAFKYWQVIPLTNEITESSNYKFTLLPDHSDATPLIKKGSMFETTFPAEVTLLDNVAPTACYREDSSNNVWPLTN
jgi:hypothetical protein